MSNIFPVTTYFFPKLNHTLHINYKLHGRNIAKLPLHVNLMHTVHLSYMKYQLKHYKSARISHWPFILTFDLILTAKKQDTPLCKYWLFRYDRLPDIISLHINGLFTTSIRWAITQSSHEWLISVFVREGFNKFNSFFGDILGNYFFFKHAFCFP